MPTALPATLSPLPPADTPAVTATTVPAATIASAPGAAAATPAAPRPATRMSIETPPASAKVFGRVELTLDTDGVFANPFDPAQADLRVRFTAPGGNSLVVPAFWYQAFDPSSLQAAGAPGWRARFTPSQPGQWSAQAELANPKLASAAVTFQVAADHNARGFVRVDSANPRYFAFDNGRPYFPIGLNIAWASSLDHTVADYQRWFGSLSRNGGNVARVWMADWSMGIEWKDTGLGDYGPRQQRAWLLDQVFSLAEKDDVYIMLSLLNHGAFSERVNPEWKDNPYNIANGGMLNGPVDFVSNEAAMAYFKRRLRYIAARWGYSTHLFAWEWWNEINWTPIYDEILQPWIVDMTQSIQQSDPYGHLITTSYSEGSLSKIWRIPQLSFMQQHDYSGHDPAVVFGTEYSAFRRTAPDKPVLVGEHGLSNVGDASQLPGDIVHFHNGLWAPPFLGYAGTALAWWWDNLVEPNNLWTQYKPIADFMQGESLGSLKPVTSTVEAGAGTLTLALEGQTRALVWVRSRVYDANPAMLAYAKASGANQITPGWTYQPPLLSGHTLTIQGLADGPYVAFWFDPQQGQWLSRLRVRVESSSLSLAVPDFNRDLAVKIVAAGDQRTPGSQ